MLYQVNAGPLYEWLMKSGLPYLLSYFYFRKLTSYFPNKPMLDSGAYSAMTLGKPINIDEYTAWLKLHNGAYGVAVNLDVINNPEVTYENQKYMESKGLQVLPCFHIKSPLKHLQQYIDEGYTYIGLGAVVGSSMVTKIKFLNHCFELGKKENIKFHGFGVGLNTANKFPFYSIDNSNATISVSIGRFVKNNQTIYTGNYSRKRPTDIGKQTRNRIVEVFGAQAKHFAAQYEKNVKRNQLMYYSYFGEDLTDEICGLCG